MLRKTLTILSLIGLLLSVGLWGVSYFRFYCHTGTGKMIAFSQGAALWPHSDHRPTGCTSPLPGASIDDYLDKQKARARRSASTLGFDGFHGFKTIWMPSYYSHRAYWRANIPLYCPTVAFGSLFGFLIVIPHHRRRKRKKLGLCLKCGYDLRASKERCPECGEAIG